MSSFAKAKQLLRLATMAAGRHLGVAIPDVIEEFGVVERTAQRMLRALEEQFPETTTSFDHENRKRWRLPPAALRDLMTLTAEELTALDLAHEALKREGRGPEAEDLARLKDKVLTLAPRARVVRLETDHEALLEAQGLAARPGPRPQVDAKVVAVVSEAIKACRVLEVAYRSWGDAEPRLRQIEPYGVLTGRRRYIVALPMGEAIGAMRLYRFDQVSEAALQAGSFTRHPAFDLRAFAARSFGVYQNEQEYGEVVWRFAPSAAAQARQFEFHPEQSFEDEPDGALIVRFHAAGHLEMCWHLYAWGDKVEVLAPERLKRMVDDHRRSDFEGMP